MSAPGRAPYVTSGWHLRREHLQRLPLRSRWNPDPGQPLRVFSSPLLPSLPPQGAWQGLAGGKSPQPPSPGPSVKQPQWPVAGQGTLCHREWMCSGAGVSPPSQGAVRTGETPPFTAACAFYRPRLPLRSSNTDDLVQMHREKLRAGSKMSLAE